MNQFRPTRFEVLPLIVKNLLIINALVFLAQNTIAGPTSDFSFEDWFALHAYQSSLFKPWQLVTHMFLHGNFGHIFGNMLALWMFGSILENLWGPGRFLAFYIICGVGAAVIHLGILSYQLIPLVNQYNDLIHSSLAQSEDYVRAITYLNHKIDVATLGASGAVFGILIAFVYLFPNTYIYIYFLFPIKAKWLGILYFSYELFFAIQNSAGDDVARWAHVGGAVIGFILVYIWNKNHRRDFY
jgi:membrane associated rhomboid family serine protease